MDTGTCSTEGGKLKHTGLDQRGSLDAAENRWVGTSSSVVCTAPAQLPPFLVLMLFPYVPSGPLGCFPRNRRGSARHRGCPSLADGKRPGLEAAAGNHSLTARGPSSLPNLQLHGPPVAWAGSLSTGELRGAGRTWARKCPKHLSAWCHPRHHQCRTQGSHSPPGHWHTGQAGKTGTAHWNSDMPAAIQTPFKVGLDEALSSLL